MAARTRFGDAGNRVMRTRTASWMGPWISSTAVAHFRIVTATPTLPTRRNAVHGESRPSSLLCRVRQAVESRSGRPRARQSEGNAAGVSADVLAVESELPVAHHARSRSGTQRHRGLGSIRTTVLSVVVVVALGTPAVLAADPQPPETFMNPPGANVPIWQTFPFGGLAGSNPIDHFECRLDYESWNTCSSPWDPDLTGGDHAIGVRAVDTTTSAGGRITVMDLEGRRQATIEDPWAAAR